MSSHDYAVTERFRNLLQRHLSVVAIAAFGSRVRLAKERGQDAESNRDADLDVLVVTETLTPQIRRIVSDCAFEAGFDDDILLSPVVFSREEWEHEAHRLSPLARTVRREGEFLPV